MKINCNVHAASFVKGDPADEWTDIKNLQPVLGLNDSFTLVYDYPLDKPARFVHTIRPDMNGEDILTLARADYERIYREEEAAAGNPGHVPGMLNRAPSKGPYGIWGHDFGDLFFEGIRIDVKNHLITFEMGS